MSHELDGDLASSASSKPSAIASASASAFARKPLATPPNTATAAQRVPTPPPDTATTPQQDPWQDLDCSNVVNVRLRTVLSPALPVLSRREPSASRLRTAVGNDDDSDELAPYDEGEVHQEEDEEEEVPMEQFPFDDGGALLLCLELNLSSASKNSIMSSINKQSSMNSSSSSSSSIGPTGTVSGDVVDGGSAPASTFGDLSFEITGVTIDILEPPAPLMLEADSKGCMIHSLKPHVNETICARLFDPDQDPQPSQQQQQQQGEADEMAKRKEGTGGTFPFVLTEGQQRNLIYCVDFIDPVPAVADLGSGRPGLSRPPSTLTNSISASEGLHAAAAGGGGGTAGAGTTASGAAGIDTAAPIRQVNIVVEAQPLLRRPRSAAAAAATNELSPHPVADGRRTASAEHPDHPDHLVRLPAFSSAWNCSVDVATARLNLRRRKEVKLAREAQERRMWEEEIPMYLAQSVVQVEG